MYVIESVLCYRPCVHSARSWTFFTCDVLLQSRKCLFQQNKRTLLLAERSHTHLPWQQ